jgi:hypothetical protein
MGANLWWVAILSVACAVQASADTIVDGNILTDTTWTAAGSPYIIEASTVKVRFGSTLTIEPGVEVRFQPGRMLTTDLDCSIAAVGTSGDRIVFTSNAESPAPSDWGKVEVYASGGSSFEHCVFRYAATGLYVIASEPVVSHCLFEDCQTGIYCQLASPTVVHSSCTRATWAAVHCYGRDSVPVIDDCNLWDNEWNVYLQFYSGSEPEVTISAENCWWGSDAEAAVAASIYDKSDNSAVNGVVDYDPWLTGQPVEGASWGVIKALFRD